MKDVLFTFLLLTVNFFCSGQGRQMPNYGDNSAAGQTISINGIEQYFEVYGSGEPLLLIHGSGQSISSMAPQIDFFKEKYKVIVPDCRSFGKTKNGKVRLTYEVTTEDMVALLDHLKIDSAYVLGWSNGGIIGLMMAMNHKNKVKKLAAMGANIFADTVAVERYAADLVYAQVAAVDQMIISNDKSQEWDLIRQQLGLLSEQPNISAEDLAQIECPVIVMAGDKDVIKTTHSLLIFNSIKRAHLCIFPGATHFIPTSNHELFNGTVETFFQSDFRRPDTRDYFEK